VLEINAWLTTQRWRSIWDTLTIQR
jgi:hypothetical protein